MHESLNLTTKPPLACCGGADGVAFGARRYITAQAVAHRPSVPAWSVAPGKFRCCRMGAAAKTSPRICWRMSCEDLLGDVFISGACLAQLCIYLKGFHGHGGTPIAGWFTIGKYHLEIDDWGGTPIVGNLHFLRKLWESKTRLKDSEMLCSDEIKAAASCVVEGTAGCCISSWASPKNSARWEPA